MEMSEELLALLTPEEREAWEESNYAAVNALEKVAELRRKVQEFEGKLQWISANLCEKHLNLVTCSSGPCGYCEAEAAERKVADLERQVKQWETWGVIEIAVRNPNIVSYCEHWEGRAEKAEARNAEYQIKLLAADKMAQVADDWVYRGVIDSRSALADARLNYGKPNVYEFTTAGAGRSGAPGKDGR